jgi:hypothetical protein
MGWVGQGLEATDAGAHLGCIGELGGPFAVIGLVILVVVLLAFVFLVVLPLLLVVFDLVVVLLLALLLVFARVLFRRPWTIEAIDPHTNSTEWKVVGWRASRELRTALRTRLEAGRPLPVELPPDGPIS